MKNFKKNSVLLLIISTFFVFFLVKDNFIDTVRIIRGADMGLILLAFMLFYIYVYLESLLMYLIVLEYKKDYKFMDTFKLIVMTKFFNGITPFSSGGQPIQIYHLKKDGIDASKGTIIIVESFLIFQFTILILGIVAIFINSIFNLFEFTNIMFYMTVIGFILNTIAFLAVFLISINQKFNTSIHKLVIKIVEKLKLKNKEQRNEKINKYFSEYYEGFQSLWKNKKLMIKGLILETLSLIILFIIPILIFKSLDIKFTLNLFTTVIIGIYIFIIGSFVPIPGGTGGTEYAFLVFFKKYIPMLSLTPALIIWRFVTYYGPVLIGGIVFNIFKKRE